MKLSLFQKFRQGDIIIKMKFIPLERKVLTISAEDYCKSIGKTLGGYKMVGVHYVGRNVREIPDYFFNTIHDAEVVVGYKLEVDGASPDRWGERIIIAAGTALIPKKKK